MLGSDGYPVLSSGLSSGGSSSLAYLFNSTSSDGKQAYTDVSGLLQVDEQGYYYYNSQENFAEFNPSDNSFALYDAAGVDAGGNSPDGQFFPFNTGDEVFADTEDSNGNLQPAQVGNRNIRSTDSAINHYFGLSMSTRFVQQYNGHTDESEATDVTYNFSGDDDAWVYIDDVLVGDLGGIHDATALEINFSSGRVYVYDDTDGDNQYDPGETVYNGNGRGQALLEIFTQAGVADNYSWNGSTFANDSYHTLDFFYPERGNTDSNMSLKYTFTLTGENNAPMPEITTATNDASGSVSFGTISYDMGDMEGATSNADGTRTKVFTYHVTETGSVDGIANDGNATQTFTVTVTDDGAGNLTAVSDPQAGAQFSFTNTYSVDPVGPEDPTDPGSGTPDDPTAPR